ncbi:MAG: DEAD/DEAH box helicase, partial [Mariniphaga sp.]|nr:DEAD/DEAH box helicase [Mariniphaga sp.]
MIENFNEFGFNPDILKAVDKMGFVTPTPIQAKTLPFILNEEKDLIAMAQTGTGKTAAFGLPMLQLMDKENRNVQSLILCPTRELCLQITSDLEKFMEFSTGIKALAVYGGASIEPQIRALKRGVHFVVGTPGRTLDLIKRKVLKVDNIKWLVLDEADEMLNMGFKEDLDAILEGTPKEKRTFLFSATIPKEISNMAKNYMSDSERISVGEQNAGAVNVNHEYYMVHARDRFEALKRIADINPKIYCIVFCRTRAETKDVADKMMQSGYNADALHGDLSQPQRTQVMDRFRAKNLQILVATDVAARGLDVNSLSHVINYNLPDDLEVYVHRSGRTGRAGKKGISIVIVHTREKGKIKEIERSAKISFERKMVPNGREICEKQLFNLIDKIERVEIEETQIDQFLPDVYKKLEWLSREDLIKKVVSVEFNRFLTYYKNSPDLNVDEQKGRGRSDSRDRDRSGGRDRGDRRERGERRDRSERRGNRSDIRDKGDRRERGERREDREMKLPSREASSGKNTRFYINLGTKTGIDVPSLIGLIKETTRDRNIPIGKIDLMKKFSFFEVEKNQSQLILDSFKNASHGSERILVEESKPFAPGKSNEKFEG